MIDHFIALPINDDLAIYRMTDTEWCVLADFEVILEVRPSLNMRELELMSKSDSSWCTTGDVQ